MLITSALHNCLMLGVESYRGVNNHIISLIILETEKQEQVSKQNVSSLVMSASEYFVNSQHLYYL